MKKIALYLFSALLALVLFSVLKEALRTHVVVNVGDTKLCIPKSYELMVDIPFLWFVEGLDEDAAGGLFSIPSAEIAESVEGYTYSHINQHKVDLKHDITGIIWGDFQIGTPDGMADEAWNINERKDHFTSKFNESLELYEIGDERYIDIWWHLAKTPPKENADIRPNDWYLGHCHGDKPDNYRCGRFLKYKNVYFDYKLLTQDIPLVKEVELFLTKKFKEWERECQS